MNEVFAEYFINEFEDPLDAYTGGMANFSGAAVAMDAMQGKPSLPTGGIKTAFHANVLQQSPVVVPKKPRVEAAQHSSISQQQPSIEQSSGLPAAPNLPQANATPIFQTVPSLGGGSVVVGSIPAQQPPATTPTRQQPASNHQPIDPTQTAVPPQATGVTAPPPPKPAPPTMNLPVGVGIRLGGIGGIVAAAAANNNATRPPTQQYALWAQQGGGALSEQALAERRQRNREHAKRSRVRKKFMLESLQEQVRALQRENRNLRLLVQEHIPEHGVQIIAECCTSALSKDDGEGEDGVTTTNNSGKTSLAKVDRTLMGALNAAQQCFVLSDPKLPDNPIIFASPGFYNLTGYTSKEVLGRNCRFLQGQGTDPRAVDVIRKAVATGSDATVCLLNYKADRTPFWNNFFVAALRDSDNNIVNFVSSRHFR